MRLTMCVAVAMLSLLSASNVKANVIISGVVDGPLTGGTPKAVELFVAAAIPDLSIYSLDYYFNANATPTAAATVTLTGSASAGDYIHITPNEADFATFFGFAAGVIGGGSINGDDSVVLNRNGAAHDVFGAPGTDGTGQPWEYLDGWAYRNNFTGPSTTFNASDWTFSGINALDNTATNATATSPMPIGTFTAVPEPSSMALLGLAGFGLMGYRRRRVI